MRSSAISMSAIIRPSEYPSALSIMNPPEFDQARRGEQGRRARPAGAPIRPLPSGSPRRNRRCPRVIRHASRNTIATAISAPARATTSHRLGWAAPNGANTVVNITGSGFQLGPPRVTRSRWMISLPQISHAHAS